MDLLLDYALEIMVKGQKKKAWVEGYFWPSRPAPVCSNPNSPAFSDDGDPAEVEIVGVLSEGKKVRLSEFSDDEFEALVDAFIKKAEADPRTEAADEEWNPVYDEDEED